MSFYYDSHLACMKLITIAVSKLINKILMNVKYFTGKPLARAYNHDKENQILDKVRMTIPMP